MRRFFFEGEIQKREKKQIFLYSVYDSFCSDLTVYLWLFFISTENH